MPQRSGSPPSGGERWRFPPERMLGPDGEPEQPDQTRRRVRESPSSAAVSIRVSRGAGSGPTRLAAFDAALMACGVADFNLVRLSSVIPPGAEVVEVSGDEQHQGGHGDLLYCVYADAYTSTPGELAWAGVAWALRNDGSKGGLFVEHTGLSEALLNRDLACQPGLDVGQSGAECTSPPARPRSLRSASITRSAPWSSRPIGRRRGDLDVSQARLASEAGGAPRSVAVHPRDRRHRPAGRPVLRAVRVDVQPAQIALGGPPGADEDRVLHPDD